MRVTFLGVGEAFDPTLPNTSTMLQADGQTLLVDCGFSAAQSFFHRVGDPHLLDGIYLTHLHADHCFGLPGLLTWMHSEGRTKPLAILGPKERLESVGSLLDRGYPGVRAKMPFPLVSAEFVFGGTAMWGAWSLATAATVHAVPNHALRVTDGSGICVMISGDGEMTPESRHLAQGVDLLVHEAYRPTEYRSGHSTVQDVLALAQEAGAKQTALVHVERCMRAEVERTAKGCLVPTPGCVLEIGG